MARVRTFFVFAILTLVAAHAVAKDPSGLSSEMPDSRTLATQRKVEKLFDRGNFDRAFFIYRNELAPVGDKYAQYMVGFMYETGLGIEQDVVSASAWYRLAAERDTREFLVVRDRLLRVFSDEQLRGSDVLYSDLRLRFSDMAVLLISIKQDVTDLQARTGSRVRAETSPVAVIQARTGRVRTGSDYYGDIERQLANSLQRLAEIRDFADIDTDPRTVNVNELERRVREHIVSHTERAL